MKSRRYKRKKNKEQKSLPQSNMLRSYRGEQVTPLTKPKYKEVPQYTLYSRELFIAFITALEKVTGVAFSKRS